VDNVNPALAWKHWLAKIRQRIANHDLELDPVRRQEIERIYQAARAAVSE
jgi:hypothetical protein